MDTLAQESMGGRIRRHWVLPGLLAWALGAGAQTPAQAGGPVAASEPAKPRLVVARDEGRLRASQLGVVVNEDDPYSVAVAARYQSARGLAGRQMLRVRLPRRARLSAEEFKALRQQIQEAFGPDIQALALAWREPYAVDCHSITGALALGLHPEACRKTCEPTPPSPYFNHGTAQPFQRFGFRPSMLLAAANEAEAFRLIERGVAADAQLGQVFGPESVALFISTRDAARNVRATWYPEPGYLMAQSLGLRRLDAGPEPLPRQERLILVQTGTAKLGDTSAFQFLPGALADHLTSFGGVLDGSAGQSTALEWLSAGATASHGTVSEPCNHLQKFPLPPLLLAHYLQGVTALEAYWKSVAWPLQSVFVGEPLAAPFSREPAGR